MSLTGTGVGVGFATGFGVGFGAATGTGVGAATVAERTATLFELVTPVDVAVAPPVTQTCTRHRTACIRHNSARTSCIRHQTLQNLGAPVCVQA